MTERTREMGIRIAIGAAPAQVRALVLWQGLAVAPDLFNDIAGHPLRKFINRIAELGITGGCGNGAYCPEATVSREAMATFLMTAFFSY